MAHEHHHHLGEASDKRLSLAVAVNVLLTVVQVGGGLVSGSLSLIADALHNLLVGYQRLGDVVLVDVWSMSNAASAACCAGLLTSVWPSRRSRPLRPGRSRTGSTMRGVCASRRSPRVCRRCRQLN